jgi:hypothetical protein
MTEPNYAELDPAVVRLCRLLNTEFPGIHTTESCQGFIDDHEPGQPWLVIFKIDRRIRNIRAAVDSLELLTWMINSDLARTERGRGIRLELNSMPPMVNRQPLYFCLQGTTGHPDQVAESIEFLLRVNSRA